MSFEAPVYAHATAHGVDINERIVIALDML